MDVRLESGGGRIALSVGAGSGTSVVEFDTGGGCGGSMTLSVGAGGGGISGGLDAMEGGRMMLSVGVGRGGTSAKVEKSTGPGIGRVYEGFGSSNGGGGGEDGGSEGAAGGGGGGDGGGGGVTDLTDALSTTSGGGGGVTDLTDALSATSGGGGGGFLGGGIKGVGKSAAVGERLEAGGKPACFSSSPLVTTGSASSYNARP